MKGLNLLAKLVETLVSSKAHSAIYYESEKMIYKVTRTMFQGNFDKRILQVSLTAGRPNYQERKFIKLCKKAGEPFPIKKIQLKFPPKKKK